MTYDEMSAGTAKGDDDSGQPTRLFVKNKVPLSLLREKALQRGLNSVGTDNSHDMRDSILCRILSLPSLTKPPWFSITQLLALLGFACLPVERPVDIR